jgi:hypothetical protein
MTSRHEQPHTPHGELTSRTAVDFYDLVNELSDQGSTTTIQLQQPPTQTQNPLIPTTRTGSSSAYRAFQERSGCNLVFCGETKRHVMMLPGAVPKPPGFTLGSKLYAQRMKQQTQMKQSPLVPSTAKMSEITAVPPTPQPKTFQQVLDGCIADDYSS